MVRRVRGFDRAQRGLGIGRDRLNQHQGAPLGGRRKRGAYAQAIGTSRGGRTSKLHGLTDATGRPRILLISPGNTSDMTMAPALLEAAAGRFDKLIADRGYDSNAIRAAVQAQGAEAVIPPTRSRKAPIPYDRSAYRARNLVERLWCRLKDWRRIATRYDKLAANYMAASSSPLPYLLVLIESGA